MTNFGKILVLVGGILVIVGFLLWIFGGKLNWFGQLPGDISIKKENFSFFAPITSMLLLSIFISFLLLVIRKFL